MSVLNKKFEFQFLEFNVEGEHSPGHQATLGTLHSIINRDAHSKAARLFKRLLDAWRLKKRYRNLLLTSAKVKKV